MADYRLHPITWKNVIDYNWLQLQITPCLIMVLEYLLYNSSTMHLLYTGGLGGSMS